MVSLKLKFGFACAKEFTPLVNESAQLPLPILYITIKFPTALKVKTLAAILPILLENTPPETVGFKLILIGTLL